jgi:hypothetical protein
MAPLLLVLLPFCVEGLLLGSWSRGTSAKPGCQARGSPGWVCVGAGLDLATDQLWGERWNGSWSSK